MWALFQCVYLPAEFGRHPTVVLAACNFDDALLYPWLYYGY